MEEKIKPRIGKWFKITVCLNCDMVINDHNRMYNRSICPHCGHDGFGTVCETYPVITRVLRYHPRWRIWNTEIKYQGKNNKSISWLKKQGLKVLG